jgi:1-acyl-sn-glycerol-3-phosphate acyltransferase
MVSPMPIGPSFLKLFASTESGVRLARLIASQFQAQLHDDERLPRAGGALFVGNHSLLGVDSVVLAALLMAETGRAPRFLTERNLSKIPGFKQLLLALGAIPGVPEDATRLLEEGELVGVYPGGIDDSFKLSREAYTLKWGNRAGFARVAMRAGAPIVPIAATGIDEIFEVDRREGFFGRLLFGRDRYDLPLPRSIIPRRVPLDFFVLPPIDTSGDPDDPEAVERVRRATWEALESVLAPYRAERGIQP